MEEQNSLKRKHDAVEASSEPGKPGKPPKASLKDLRELLGLRRSDSGDGEDVYLISIDCEAYEFAQDKITEIGVSVVRVADLRGIEPGVDASAWLEQIKSAHFRPTEYAGLTNKRWVQGCPDNFDFGLTEWIYVAQARNVLRRIFNDPSALDTAHVEREKTASTGAKIILVGHGLGNDKRYLGRIGFSPNSFGNVIQTMDTQKMLNKEQVGMKHLLAALGIEPKHLHNAGNDAAYALQALLLMALKEHTAPGSLAVAIREAISAAKNLSVPKSSSSDAPIAPGSLAQEATPAAEVAFKPKMRRSDAPIASGSLAQEAIPAVKTTSTCSAACTNELELRKAERELRKAEKRKASIDASIAPGSLSKRATRNATRSPARIKELELRRAPKRELRKAKKRELRKARKDPSIAPSNLSFQATPL